MNSLRESDPIMDEFILFPVFVQEPFGTDANGEPIYRARTVQMVDFMVIHHNPHQPRSVPQQPTDCWGCRNRLTHRRGLDPNSHTCGWTGYDDNDDHNDFLSFSDIV